MTRIRLINLMTFFCLVLGLVMFIVGVLLSISEMSFSGGAMVLLSGVIALIGNELLAIRKILDRLDRGYPPRGSGHG